ncbi:hypothetical protein [Halomonas sp. M4R1S46]|uniref:hypothetical protein n=1 Tax=Halomonas sp. M4R1S46 TaxID=2982692 RepID=UPI0021E4BE81|nr:hypothetical protein [Halomonas sp. M4R1S46]UYG08988.1 hypothetical protein OCT48_06565 [Halomonas sp. M4R1S46]
MNAASGSIIHDAGEHEDAWLETRLPLEGLERRVMGIDPALGICGVQAIGFPYLLCLYRWETRRWGVRRQELMSCLVDRCQGVSTTLEGVEFGDPLASAVLPPPELDTPPLERKARHHVMQVCRHRLKRRSAAGLELVCCQSVRKPLWRVTGCHARHGELELLIDGLNGGYYLL